MEDNKQFIEMTHFEHVDIPHTIESIADYVYPEARTNEKRKYHADEPTKQRAIELWNARIN